MKKTECKIGISDAQITEILDLCEIDPILETFQKQFIAIGGTKEEVEQEFCVVKDLIESDLLARLSKDPAVHNDTAFVMRDIAFQSLILYRISHALWSPQYVQYEKTEAHNARLTSLDLHNYAKKFHIELHPGMCAGRGLYLDHALSTKIQNGVRIGQNCGLLDGILIGDVLSILIGEQTYVGDHVTIEREVVCGATIKRNPHILEVERMRGRRHPRIEDNCFISRGAKLLGPITIAANSFVPIGAIVINDFPLCK